AAGFGGVGHPDRCEVERDGAEDINHWKNKRIRSVADLLQDQFGLALVRLENMVRVTERARDLEEWIWTSAEGMGEVSATMY
ncbi:hypothetical protein KC220_26530, partial [Mycobacterium tuberculosis]|nr:hypothetical protein [Mycobacterium tuberculosis]